LSEHVSSDEIERYKRRLISSEELMALDAHLASCESCRLLLLEPARVESSIELMRGDFAPSRSHLGYDQLAAYTDGQLTDVDLEITATHLQDCHSCQAELRELQAFSRELSELGENAAVPAAPQSPLQRFATGLTSRWLRPALQFAAVAMVVALIVWAATLPLRREVSSLDAQLAQLRQDNERLRQQYEETKSAADTLQARLDSLANGSPGSPSVAIIDGGSRLTIDSAGNVEGLDSIPIAYQQMVRSALVAGQVQFPQDLNELAGNAVTLMSGSVDGVPFALESPLGKVILSDRPLFRWQRLEGATAYRVSVFDSEFNQIVISEPVTTNSWRCTKPLELGRIYNWQVTALKNGNEVKSPVPPAPEARFKVVDKVRSSEIASQRSRHPDSHLISGLLYARAGLLVEAESEFRLLERNNPESAIPKKLLRSIRSLPRK